MSGPKPRYLSSYEIPGHLVMVEISSLMAFNSSKTKVPNFIQAQNAN